MVETPDWIVEMCARFIFELHIVAFLAEQNKTEDDRPDYPGYDWNQMDASSKRTWIEEAWKVVAEGKTDEEMGREFPIHTPSPTAKAIELEDRRREWGDARALAALLRTKAGIAYGDALQNTARRRTAEEEREAIYEGRPLPRESPIHQFHGLWTATVGLPHYVKGPWLALESKLWDAERAGNPADRNRILQKAAKLAAYQKDPAAFAKELHDRAYALDVQGLEPEQVDLGYRSALEVVPTQPEWRAHYIGFLLARGTPYAAYQLFQASEERFGRPLPPDELRFCELVICEAMHNGKANAGVLVTAAFRWCEGFHTPLLDELRKVRAGRHAVDPSLWPSMPPADRYARKTETP